VSGEDQSYIFSLIPRFKFYDSKRGAGGLTHVNINEGKQGYVSPGIGFGKFGTNKHRVWLDKDI